MSDLVTHLARLQDWLREIGSPPWKHVLIFEDPKETTSRMPRTMLKTVSEYEQRFEELLDSGYSWINLNGAGILEGSLVVVVEFPRESVGAPRDKVSVNLSCPTNLVRSDPSWDLSAHVD